ncbi:MAG: SH3 domain-containing protein, partial [Sphingobacteriales bacterium]
MYTFKKSLLMTMVLGLLVFSGFAQSLGSVISTGSRLGTGLSDNIRDKKKQKNIEAGISQHEVAGKQVITLRVPSDKIVSPAKNEISSLQAQLDRCFAQFQANQTIDGSNVDEFSRAIRLRDPSWPVHYYDAEWTIYDEHNRVLTQKAYQLKDSLWRAGLLAEQRRADSIQNAKLLAEVDRQKRLQQEKDSIALASITLGYHFVNRPFIILKEKPTAASTDIGKLYLGTYVKFTDDLISKEYVKVMIGEGLEGFVLRSDLTNKLDSIDATAAEQKRLRSAHYYKFEESTAWRAKREAIEARERAAEEREIAAAERREAAEEAAFRKSAPGKKYHLGPKGGCYY